MAEPAPRTTDAKIVAKWVVDGRFPNGKRAVPWQSAPAEVVDALARLAASAERNAKAARSIADAPCNICGRGWPHHEEACAYAVHLRDLEACTERCEELESELTRQQEMWSAQSRVIGVLAAEVPDDVRARVLAPLRAVGSTVPSLAERCDTLTAALEQVLAEYHARIVTDEDDMRGLPFRMKEIALAALAKAAPEPEPGG